MIIDNVHYPDARISQLSWVILIKSLLGREENFKPSRLNYLRKKPFVQGKVVRSGSLKYLRKKSIVHGKVVRSGRGYEVPGLKEDGSTLRVTASGHCRSVGTEMIMPMPVTKF